MGSRTSRSVRTGADAIDYYPTPGWCVDRLMDALELPGGRWLEPCAGDGAIVRAVEARRTDITWTTVDVREDSCAEYVVDYLAWAPPLDNRGRQERYRVAVTNPPFSRMLEIVQRMRTHAEIVVALGRLGWLASAKRHEWLRAHMPRVYVLPQRPIFNGVNSDSSDYAWYVWGISGPAVVQILGLSPRAERVKHNG